MARPKYSLAVKGGGGGQVKSLTLTLTGMTLEALVARTAKLIMPEKGKIIAVTANVAAKGGTPGTDTLDVTAGATSLLAATFNLNTIVAGTPVQKDGAGLSATADSVAEGTELRFTTAQSGGTSPTLALLTVQVDYVPLGD